MINARITRNEYVEKVIAISKKHFNKYGYYKMSPKEFKDLFELNKKERKKSLISR